MRINIRYLPHGWTLRDMLEAYPPQATPVFTNSDVSYWISDDTHYPFYIMNDYLARRGNAIMAAKGTRNRKKATLGEYSFVRTQLTGEDKKAAKAWFEKHSDELDKKMHDVLASGHKVSFSYNETNQSVTCTFTGKPEESVNEYRMLTSFASSWWQALALGLWKTEVLFSSGVWEDLADEDDFG